MPENDAISRRQAVSRMSDLICLELKGKCPTWNDVYKAMNELPTVEPELLKEQKAIRPTWSRGKPFCGACGLRIHGGKFCSECGKPILWEGGEQE